MTKQEIQAEIEEFSALLNESSVPQDEKDFAKGEIDRLKSELAKLSDKPAKKATAKPAKKSPAKPKAESKPEKKAPAKAADPDCDEVLEQWKKRKARQKKSAKKSANTPTAKKDEKAIDKTVDRIKKHYKEGELTVAAIKALIKELTEKLDELRELLKTSEKKKFNLGGGVGDLKEGDYVWNAVGKKLIVNKVTPTEYYLSKFGQMGDSPWSKSKVNKYIQSGEWTLIPKFSGGGGVGAGEDEIVDVEIVQDKAYGQGYYVIREYGTNNILHAGIEGLSKAYRIANSYDYEVVYAEGDDKDEYAKGGGVGDENSRIIALGLFYYATSEFERKFKIGGKQKLQKIVGKELYYKSENGKKWFWNNPVIKKMTASELNALTKKIQDQMPGEKGWKHKHKA